MKFARNTLPYILLSIIGIGLYVYYSNNPNRVRKQNEKIYTAYIQAKLIKTEPICYFDETHEGRFTRISHFYVNYSYTISDQQFFGYDNIPNKRRYSELIQLLYKKPGQYLPIQYNPNDPSKSMIRLHATVKE